MWWVSLDNSAGAICIFLTTVMKNECPIYSTYNIIKMYIYTCMCVFIKLHITAQPGPLKLIFQCYSNGSALWMCGGGGVFIKLHITAQHGPVKLIFQCYSSGSALWGISVCV